jgi:hypothetical protein
MGATRRNLQALPKILKKIIEPQIYQSKRKFSQKKVCLIPQKCKGAKNSYGGYPTEFAPGASKAIGLKLSSENLNLKRKKCLGWKEKKLCALQNLLTDGGRTNGNFFFVKNHFLSIKSSNSSRTSQQHFGYFQYFHYYRK